MVVRLPQYHFFVLDRVPFVRAACASTGWPSSDPGIQKGLTDAGSFLTPTAAVGADHL